MSTNRSKLRVTKSLLDSWLWSFKRDDGYEDFLRTLRREKTPPTKAMLDGVRYENCLNGYLNGETISEYHEWYAPITEMGRNLWGASQQVVLFSDTEVDGQPILLHGVLDYLKAGHIYDCKFTKHYALNKYYWEHTTQTAMYLALVPEAMDFTYIVSDGKYVYRERYPRDIVPPIEPTIKCFMDYLKKHELFEIFTEKWRVRD